MLKKYRPLYLILVVALVLASCTPSVPEQPYIPVETIVAATYAVISAQTEAARPTETSTPLPPTATRPPDTETPTPTVTFVIKTSTPSLTPTSTAKPTATNVVSQSGDLLYACKILSQSPRNVHRVKVKETFQWSWQIENAGNTIWDPSDTKAIYTSGTMLANKKDYPITDRIKPGNSASFTLKVTAPSGPGKYTTTWSMRTGIHSYCYVTLEIDAYK